jgi:hypothetical protein
MELQKGFELGLLVGMTFILAQSIVEELRDGVCNRSYLTPGVIKSLESAKEYLPNKYIRVSTKGAHRAPIASPYLTLTACGIILEGV